jgi:hypothetical protein
MGLFQHHLEKLSTKSAAEQGFRAIAKIASENCQAQSGFARVIYTIYLKLR